MGNENLRAALGQAGLSPDELARIVQVDVRTVRRWLSGGTPYPRQRGKVARALDATEHDLWPEAATRPPGPLAAENTDLVTAYSTGSDPAAPDWHALMQNASGRIDLLSDTLMETLGAPGVAELLAATSSHGCAVRILIHDTDEHIAPLMNRPGIEIRILSLSAEYVIFRFDEQLLLSLHLVGSHPENAPLLHVRRAAPDGLFDRLTSYYDELWTDDGEQLQLDPPARAGEELDEREDPDTEPRRAATDQLEPGPSEIAAPPARRWPGRDRPRTHG